MMPILPALGLLTLYPLHLLIGRHGLTRRLVRRPSAAGLVVVWLYIIIAMGTASFREVQFAWDVKPHWYSTARARPAPHELRAAEVTRLTESDDTIYVWGWDPGTYRFTLRRPASRFATIEKRGQVGEHAQFIVDGAIADILAAPPRVFVISRLDYAGMMASPGEFGRWIRDSYAEHGEVEGMHILLRRTPEPAAERLDITDPSR